MAFHLGYERRTEVYSGSGRVDNTLGEDTAISTFTPELSIGLGRGLSVTVAVPVVRMHYQILRHQTMQGEPLPRFDETQTGLSDAPVILQWAGGPASDSGVVAWGGIGISIPLGLERDYPALRGMEFGEVLTMGSGTWDPLLVHGVALSEGSRVWSSGFVWRWTPYENRFGYRVGSVVQWEVAMKQAILETGVSVGLQLGYRHQWRARRDGVEVLNSGGDWVTVTPELRWKATDTLQLAAKVGLPVWRDIYAGPDDIDQIVNGQTDADQRWMLSLIYEFGG